MHFFIPTAATGNSVSLATIGRTGELMGFFYPRIDQAQNVREAMPAIRHIDGNAFLWTFAECWRVAQSMDPGSNVVVTRLVHRDIDLTLEINDVLPPGEPVLMRRIALSMDPRIGKVQFIHYFKLVADDSVTRNAVQAYPEDNVVVQHYRHVSLAVAATEPFAAQCSTYPVEGQSPTKQAIQYGHFGSSLQAIGRVDFAIGFEPVQQRRWQTTLVLAGGPTRPEATATARRLLAVPFDKAVHAAHERVDEILGGAGVCTVPELSDGFDRAVIALHDLYDQNEGTFIAAPEFDPGYELSGGYGYCWPRDAAVCALAMQQIGRPEQARRFFDWTRRTQLSDGHWYQRYWTDGSPAPSWCVRSTEIQLDQTCAIVHAAGVFARRLDKEAESFVSRYRPVVEKAADAICRMIDERGMHRPATDLWENSTGSFTYTQAGVIAALREADEVFGFDPKRCGPDVRAKLKAVLIRQFWQPGTRRWLRRITPEGAPDPTLDSSVMGLIEPWGVLVLGDPTERALALDTLEGISRDLRCPVKGGSAVLRFQGESYMGGGPGCVNTLWLGLCRMRLATTARSQPERTVQRGLAMKELEIALANTSPTGQLPELIPKVWFDYWAAPHAWACSLLIEIVLALRSLDPQSEAAFAAQRARVRRRAPSR